MNSLGLLWLCSQAMGRLYSCQQRSGSGRPGLIRLCQYLRNTWCLGTCLYRIDKQLL